MDGNVPYILRGVDPVSTDSSLLVSSSKYLNDARLRDWVAMICLRKNGRDFPAPAELRDMMQLLEQLRDHDRIERLFTEERKDNPEFDAWLAEGFLSLESRVADYRHYAPGTLGGTLYAQLAGKYEVEIVGSQWDPARTQFEFFWCRQVQTHEFEHILTGGGIDALGELVPSWFRMANIPRHVRSQELAGEFLIINLLASLRYTARTMLHYPEVWTHALDAIQRGTAAGQVSDALFMKRMEPYLHMPLQQAREALGVRGVVEREMAAASAFWEGETIEPPPPCRAPPDPIIALPMTVATA